MIRKTENDKIRVIDINGTYVHILSKGEKIPFKSCKCDPVPLPDFLLANWQAVKELNAMNITKQLPCILPTTLYTTKQREFMLRVDGLSREVTFTGHLGA